LSYLNWLKKSYLIFTYIPCIVQAPFLYTFSRQQRATNVASPPGIGWSPEGFAKYNLLYDAVVEDRVSRGGVFNEAMLSFYLERRRSMVAKPNRAIDAMNCKAIPRDDLDMLDTRYHNVTALGFDHDLNSTQA
jgi:hypothetical protein